MKTKSIKVLEEQIIEKWNFSLKLFEVVKKNDQVVYAVIEKNQYHHPTFWFDNYSDAMLHFQNHKVKVNQIK